MTSKKSKLNWYFIVAGVLLLYINFSNGYIIRQDELRRLTVELKGDIIDTKERKLDYKFWTTEYNNQFNIVNGSITRGKHEPISNLKKGQKVDILISLTDYNNLGKKNKDIIIRGLSINEVSLLSPNEFLKNQLLYKKRLMVIGGFIGLLLLLNGLTTVPGRINYAVVGTFAGALIIMRIFEFGLF